MSNQSNDLLWSKSQVRWRCRRGLKELDIILLGFFDRCYEQLSLQEKLSLQFLLLESDPVLQKWLVFSDTIDVKHKHLKSFLDRIRENQDVYRSFPVDD